VRLEELVPSCRTFNDIIAAKTFANRDKDREALHELLDIQERGCLAYRERHRSGIEFKMNDDPDRDIEPYVQADSTETETRSIIVLETPRRSALQPGPWSKQASLRTSYFCNTTRPDRHAITRFLEYKRPARPDRHTTAIHRLLLILRCWDRDSSGHYCWQIFG